MRTVIIISIIATVCAFLFGYIQGLQMPREPTFAERVYKNNEIAQLNHDYRCKQK